MGKWFLWKHSLKIIKNWLTSNFKEKNVLKPFVRKYADIKLQSKLWLLFLGHPHLQSPFSACYVCNLSGEFSLSKVLLSWILIHITQENSWLASKITVFLWQFMSFFLLRFISQNFHSSGSLVWKQTPAI